MAEQLPNLYTFGQVRVDTTPLAALQGKLLAQRQAKDEALNKYYNDLTGKITSAGMHQKDIPGFLEKKKELSSFWNANKNEIRKGGLAKQEFDAKANRLFADVTQSKEDVKFLYDMRDKVEAEDLPKLEARSKSIYDPSYYKDYSTKTPYTYSDFSAAIKLPEFNEQNQFWNAISQGYTPKVKEYQKDDKGKIIFSEVMPGSFEKVAKFNQRYSDDQILGMAERAGAATLQSPKFTKLYNSYLKNEDSPEFKELATTYNQYFPKDVMDKPEKVAKAAAILRFKKFTNTGEEKFTDERAKKSYESALIQSRSKGQEGDVDLSKYDILGAYTQNKGVTTKGLFGGLFGGGGKTLVYKKDIDPNDYKLIAGDDAIPYMDNSGNEYFIVDPNTGDWQAENATISASSVARRNLDRTSLAEEKRGVIGFKPGAPIPGKSVPSGRSYKVGSKTFTLEQMKKGASKAKMNLDEYLKSIGAK